MEKRDARKLDLKAQYQLRKKIVRLREKGKSNMEIAEIVGVHPTHVSTIYQQYLKGGDDALKPKVRGRGKMRSLMVGQDEKIKEMLIEKKPEQLNLPFLLWNREAIRFAINQEFGVDLRPRTITDYLKRWGVPSQRPLNRAGVKDLVEVDYLGGVLRAKREGAEINWFNLEKVVGGAFNAHEDTCTSKSCIKMISATSSQGKVRFLLFSGEISKPIFIKFVSRLVKETGRKVLLILRGDEVQFDRYIGNWKHPGRLVELLYLPPALQKHESDR